jgi:diguanylate cyclase (GGDEF)-like protein
MIPGKSFLLSVCALSAMLLTASAWSLTSQEAGALLKKADSIKTSDPTAFGIDLQALDTSAGTLSPDQLQYLRYLKGWRSAYEGDYQTAITTLESLIDESRDSTLRFRAGATVVNVLSIAAQYEQAFSRLSELMELLPQVEDQDAREQGLTVAAFLYNQVDQNDLGLRYAEQLIEHNRSASVVCTGQQLRMEALYRSRRLEPGDSTLAQAIDSCTRIGEFGYANVIRTYVARLYLGDGRGDDAIRLLKQHYEEVQKTRYPRLISEFDALLADAYLRMGDLAAAKQSGERAVAQSVKNEFTEPLASAYRVLYSIAKREGDFNAALTYHEKYSAADKGYLDDISARQLAFQRARHESTANKLQIDALNKQNQLLTLQREINLLYIALLIVGLSFIGYWAYKTKLSQLHFMKLSRHDGLTGIFNRPHFIEQAELMLAEGRRTERKLCVVLCDLDHFKTINDRFGHAAGDAVLKQTVAACQAHLGPMDLFGRFGGEEFGILFADCDLEQAQRRSEQMRMSISKISMGYGGGDSVSASFGVAATLSSGYELRELLADADAALYQAKRSGRNRVASFEATDRTAAA